MALRGPRYAPAARLQEVRALVDSAAGASIYDIAERLDVSARTALRYVQPLQAAGEPLYEDTVGRRKVWRLMPAARKQAITLTTSQMVALFLSRRVFDFLAGTGFKEDLDDASRSSRRCSSARTSSRCGTSIGRSST
jgi:predicted DNA-binding transcriptional regulator YafY